MSFGGKDYVNILLHTLRRGFFLKHNQFIRGSGMQLQSVKGDPSPFSEEHPFKKLIRANFWPFLK